MSTHVEDNGNVAGLACKACPGSSCEHGSVEVATDSEGFKNVVLIHGTHDTDGRLPVVRGIGGIDSSSPGVEQDLAAHGVREIVF
ncbi:MAG: hypothetical protein M0T79_03635 [Actinomycetota bacterium]|nr:hypothetical protein [Actinomycetota bacterium]